MVEFHVQFDGSFSGAELGPVVERQTEIDGGGIQAIDFIFESEFVFRGNGLAFGQHPEKDFFKKLMGTVFVDIEQGRTVNRLNPQVVQALELGGQPRFDVLQAILSGKLPKEHGGKMVPRPEPAGVVLRSSLGNEPSEFKSRNICSICPNSV